MSRSYPNFYLLFTKEGFKKFYSGKLERHFQEEYHYPLAQFTHQSHFETNKLGFQVMWCTYSQTVPHSLDRAPLCAIY